MWLYSIFNVFFFRRHCVCMFPRWCPPMTKAVSTLSVVSSPELYQPDRRLELWDHIMCQERRKIFTRSQFRGTVLSACGDKVLWHVALSLVYMFANHWRCFTIHLHLLDRQSIARINDHQE